MVKSNDVQFKFANTVLDIYKEANRYNVKNEALNLVHLMNPFREILLHRAAMAFLWLTLRAYPQPY
jgi:hypothetical protein